MKNLLDDPDVLNLYKSLQSKKYQSIEDYLESSYVEDTPIAPVKKDTFTPNIKFGGESIQNFEEDFDYGL